MQDKNKKPLKPKYVPHDGACLYTSLFALYERHEVLKNQFEFNNWQALKNQLLEELDRLMQADVSPRSNIIDASNNNNFFQAAVSEIEEDIKEYKKDPNKIRMQYTEADVEHLFAETGDQDISEYLEKKFSNANDFKDFYIKSRSHQQHGEVMQNS